MKSLKQVITVFLLAILPLFPNLAMANENADGAAIFIDSNAKKILSVLTESNTSNTDKEKKLISLFLEATDYEWMGKFAIGKYWNTLSEVEQKQYIETYKNYLVSIYVPKYIEYNKQTYNIASSKNVGEGRYIVTMEINSSNSNAPIIVEYNLKDYGKLFKVRDILAEGISLISTQRADFTSFLANNSIESLISNLKSKTLHTTEQK